MPGTPSTAARSSSTVVLPLGRNQRPLFPAACLAAVGVVINGTLDELLGDQLDGLSSADMSPNLGLLAVPDQLHGVADDILGTFMVAVGDRMPALALQRPRLGCRERGFVREEGGRLTRLLLSSLRSCPSLIR